MANSTSAQTENRQASTTEGHRFIDVDRIKNNKLTAWT